MPVDVACEQCGKMYREKPYRARDPDRRNFCSKACYWAHKPTTARPLADRFWEKVSKGEGCWLWTGTFNHYGYGVINRGGRGTPMVQASRIAWELAHGPIEKGMFICHHCDNPSCVRLDHLFLGTGTDNMRDKVEKGRQTKGESVPSSKLTAQNVLEIRRRYAAREADQLTLAREFGVSGPSISNIITRTTWKHLPDG